MLNLNDSSCPFCDGNRLVRYSASAHDAKKKRVNIIECQTCQAGWQWPLQRTEQQSAMEFENAYADHNDGTYFDLEKREAVANCQFEFLKTKIERPGRLLDVGCGDGHFARYMANRGWDVVGLDPALLRGVTEDISPGRLSLQCDSIANLPPDQIFDLVTLWDVVEHVEKPDQLINEAAARLAPGGILVVETGNYQCAGRIHSKGTWWNYQIDHRWYFAPPQLNALLTRAGLNHIELADKVLRPWWKGHCDMPSPRLITLVKAIARRPWRTFSALRCHNDLKQGRKQWTGWGGLEIMTMIGHKLEPAPV
ncbi:MAG: class I SAM-dependent methyltransferase [Rhodoferax sp.]|uniref:class I SAM-dependent methyltransferase n=1 Tax=Rhodoferax sp. TaxID=50421 RepID=UPI00271B065E|nr:class I SAM-dependent methyltransferase [Rhodoferax sp.]MDO8449168.1 class I SAM-dependent methyltransferase [Rhodoferax sp.]